MNDYGKTFSWTKALWKGLTTAMYIAGPLGLAMTQISEQAPALPSDTGDSAAMWSWLVALGLVVFRVVMNVWKHKEMKGNPLYSFFIMSFLVLTVGLSGCQTMLPAQSKANIVLHEVQADGYVFDLTFQTKGDIQGAGQELMYQGEGENPWKLVVGQNVTEMTSPATLAGVEAWATVAKDASMIISAITPLLRPAPLEPLDAAASTAPTVLEILMNAFAGR